MKILVSRMSWTPGQAVGGAEQSAVLHGKLLIHLGHQAKVITNYGVNEAAKPFVRQIWMPASKLVGQLTAFLVLPWKAIFYRPDVINPHSRFDQIAFSLTKWLHRCPVVWKDPGELAYEITTEKRGLLGRLNQKLYVAAIKRANFIYTLDRTELSRLLDTLEQLGEAGLAKKFRIVPSDISFDDYNLDAHPPQTKAKIVFGTVLRLDEHKGVQYLIKAYQNLDLKDSELWIIGDGSYKDHLQELAKARDDIKFWGYKTQISPYLKGIDIFIQPAEYEGWGRNVKEAMYFSLPVVGSNVGGIAEQIEDNKTGLLFEPKNAEQLQQKLEMLINDPDLRAKLGKNANGATLKNGDYKDLMKDKVIPIFEQALKN